MATRRPDFRAEAVREGKELGPRGAARIMEEARALDLAPVLRVGGALVFPHIGLAACGFMVGAAVRACFECGARRVLAIGVLHALTDELEDARRRVAAGEPLDREPTRGIQGPGLAGRDDWRDEFSLVGFRFLWQEELRRRDSSGPELVERYPFLAGGRPGTLAGMAELERIATGSAIVATADPFHHGVGYGDPREHALAPDRGGLAAARRATEEGLALLAAGDYWGYHNHCITAKSDARDVGQVLRFLTGPTRGRVLAMASRDTSQAYGAAQPTWVAGALIELLPEGAAR